MSLPFVAPAARKAVVFTALALSLFYGSSALAQGTPVRRGKPQKFDQELSSRAQLAASWRLTRLIVRLNGKPLPPELQVYQRGRLDLIDAWLLEMPDRALNLVAQAADVTDA